MNPTTIQIEGFGPYRAPFEIDLTDMNKVVAITGANGTGKTFLLESIFAALNGRWPSHGHITTPIPAGVTNARLALTFSHRGADYQVERLITIRPSGTKSTATLTCDGKQLAGPKIRDVDAAIASLLGSPDIHLATWFCAQGSRGDFAQLKPSERRDVFAALLDFARLQKMSDAAAKLAVKAEGSLETLSAQMGDAVDFEGVIATLSAAKSEREAELEAVRAKLAEVENERETIKDAIARAGAGDEQHKAVVDRYNQAVMECGRIESSIKELLYESSKLKLLIGEIEGLVTQVEQLIDCRDRLAYLKAEQSKFEVWREWDRKRESLQSAYEFAAKQLDQTRKLATVDNETRELASQLEAIGDEYRAAKKLADKIKAENDAHVRALSAIEGDLRANERELEQLQKRAANTPETPADYETCQRCPLMTEWAGLDAQIQSKLDTINGLLGELDHLRGQVTETPPDLLEINTRGEQARAAKDKVRAAEKYAAELNAIEAKLGELDADVNAHKANEPERSQDYRTKIAEIENRISELEVAPARLEKAHDAQKRDEGLQVKIRGLHAELEQAQSKREELLEPYKHATELLNDRATKLRALEDELETANESIRGLKNQESVCTNAISEIGFKIQQTNGDQERRAAQAQEVATLRKRIDGLRWLQTAFGKKGVQAILIDQASPMLETITNKLLSRIESPYKYIRISTQRANASGDILEDILIVTPDEYGIERDISTFSGGEKRELSTILRAAVCIWANDIAGQPTGIFCADETFDATDSERRDRVISLLKVMGEQFDRIFAITHEPDVAARLDSQINLVSVYDGVKVSRP